MDVIHCALYLESFLKWTLILLLKCLDRLHVAQMSHRSSLLLLFTPLRCFVGVARLTVPLCRSISCSPASLNADSRDSLKESAAAKLDHSFRVLGLDKADCTAEHVKKAYIKLVKQYHPDMRNSNASAEKFAEVSTF